MSMEEPSSPENPTVADYYKRELLPEYKGTFTKCIPNWKETDECSFAKNNLITDYSDKLKLLEKFGYNFPMYDEDIAEAQDWIRECPILILKAGITLCHTTHHNYILSFKKMEEKKELYTTEIVGWWRKYFPGQEKYGGGWFTYGTEYGGPGFGMSLYYKLDRDVPVLFIPNQRARIQDKAYYPEGSEILKRDRINLDPEYSQYSGSHIIIGVKDWKANGHKEIVPQYYADQLAERLVNLGFPGYISCDECEVFITHEVMKQVRMNRPYKIKHHIKGLIPCEECKRGFYDKKSDGNMYCTNCKSPMKKRKEEDERTIYDMIVDLLCGGNESCPINAELEVNKTQKDRDVLVFKKLTKTDLRRLGMTYEQFMGECRKVKIELGGETVLCDGERLQSIFKDK